MTRKGETVGYEGIKRKLERTADVLANPKAYSALGVHAPRALLLYGNPGVGKTLMARCLIKKSGRASIICRKNEPNGTFVKVIKRRFEEAERLAPSILLLDDLDKFANADRRNCDAEEYVTVQSCLDELAQAGSEVFVLATANNLQCLPHSLTHTGRLGDKVKVSCPTDEGAERIIAHYLSGKKAVDEIDAKFLARMMGGHSCAELEDIVNEAGLLAGFERSESITNEHIIRAVLKAHYHIPEKGLESCKHSKAALVEREHVAIHEAGHMAVSEALLPGSVTLAVIFDNGKGATEGFSMSDCASEANSKKKRRIDILVSLGGRAAIEQRHGKIDTGSALDLACAFKQVRTLVEDTCCCGFTLHSYGNISEELRERIEQATAQEVERCYRKAKEILALNSGFVDAVASALLEDGVVTMHDIAEIKERIKVIPVAL